MTIDNELSEFIINNTTDGIMIKNSKGEIEFLNKSAEVLFGKNIKILKGKTSFSNIVRAIHLDYSVMSPENHPSVIVQKEQRPVLDNIVGFLKENNTVSWVKTNCYPFKSGTLSIFKDITKELKERSHSEMLMRALNSFAIVSTTNLKGDITYVNDRFCEKTQYSRAEILGQNHRILKSGKHPDSLYKEMWASILKGHIFQGEVCNKKKNGELIWGFSTIIPMYENNQVNGFLSVRFDITEKKRLEELLETSAKLTTLGEISASIAHEINNPLTILLGKTNLINTLVKKNKYDLSQLPADLSKIEGAGLKIIKIIKGLKSLARNSESDPKEKIIFSDILSDVLELTHDKMISHNVILQNNINEDFVIECNPSQISQVLVNLISNAVDAISEQKDKWIKLEHKIFKKYIQIKVTDSGKGIPENILNQIMNPFFTTKPAGVGTGLGLSISKKIIEVQHLGKFYYEKQEANTTFVIELSKELNNKIELLHAQSLMLNSIINSVKGTISQIPGLNFENEEVINNGNYSYTRDLSVIIPVSSFKYMGKISFSFSNHYLSLIQQNTKLTSQELSTNIVLFAEKILKLTSANLSAEGQVITHAPATLIKGDYNLDNEENELLTIIAIQTNHCQFIIEFSAKDNGDISR